MERYEELKQVIQQANPEIMELKFGCLIEIDSKHPDTYISSIGDGSYNLLDSDGQPYRWHGRIHPLQILGRQIRLADCLMAIRVRDNVYFGMVADQGIDHIFIVTEDVVGILRNWNLRDDNLDHQSDETKQFLIDLLVK